MPWGMRRGSFQCGAAKRMSTILRTILACLLAAPAVRSEGPDFDEYQVKAAFLYNFAKFVKWPADAFSDPDEPVTICVLGQSPLGSVLAGMARGKWVEDRPLTVRLLPKPQQMGACQILFIAASEKKRVWMLLDQIAGANILTVGEFDEFTAVGGMVNLKRNGTSVRIQVALDAVEHGRLLISSRLLSLAEIVRK
jgi:uncharacterized protein DUF4154